MLRVCLKEEIGRRLPADDVFTAALGLLCCSYCKKMQRDEEVDRLYKLFVEPLYISFLKEEHVLFRVMASALLENTAKLFESSGHEQEEMKKIMEAVAKSASTGTNRHLIRCLSQVSPGAYLQLMARWHYSEIYDAAFATALCFLAAKTDLHLLAFRVSFINREDHQTFFDIGVSLDEGWTEYLTQKLMKSSGDEASEDAYYFEVEFYKNIEKKFGFTKKDVGTFFSHGGLIALYNRTKALDQCFFYDLFDLSDHQRWREVYQLLKSVKEVPNGGDSN